MWQPVIKSTLFLMTLKQMMIYSEFVVILTAFQAINIQNTGTRNIVNISNLKPSLDSDNLLALVWFTNPLSALSQHGITKVLTTGMLGQSNF